MQDPRSSSTLELVVNDNMNNIDLGTPSVTPTGRPALNHSATSVTGSGEPDAKWFKVSKWPSCVRDAFNARMDEARAKSDSNTEFALHVARTFGGILIWALCFVFTIIVPVILFFVGLLTLDSCDDRPSLPYLVFTLGFAMTASNLFNLALSLDLPVLSSHNTISADLKNMIASIINIIFNCIVVFLYILNAHAVLSMSARQQPSSLNPNSADDNTEPPVCNAVLYNFTYWLIVVSLSLSALLGLAATLLYAYNRYRLAIIRGSMPRSQTNGTSVANSTVSINQVPSNRVC